MSPRTGQLRWHFFRINHFAVETIVKLIEFKLFLGIDRIKSFSTRYCASKTIQVGIMDQTYKTGYKGGSSQMTELT